MKHLFRPRLAATLFVLFLLTKDSFGQSPTAHPALNEPDKFGWDLFIRINHPADLNAPRGTAAVSRRIGDPGPTVWETWKLARTEVFLETGCKPPAWDDQAPIPKAVVANRTLAANIPPIAQLKHFDPPKFSEETARANGFSIEEEPLVQPQLRLAARLSPALPVPTVDQELGNETRMNKAAFEFILNRKLYNIDGQEAFFTSGLAVEFPVDAIEIKAAWRGFTKDELDPAKNFEDLNGDNIITDDERGERLLRRKFHTGFGLDDNQQLKLFGLVAIHIITKDIPNWFWATFEHKDNPEPEIPHFDRSTDPDQRFPKELAGTIWQNYRLRGTQVDFTTSTGRPTVLGNTQIEGGFQATSSCITCHSRASIGEKPATGAGAKRLSIFEDLHALRRFPALPATDPQNCAPNPIPGQRCIPRGPTIRRGAIGRPDPSLYVVEGTRGVEFAQLDFVWSLMRARRRNASCPND